MTTAPVTIVSCLYGNNHERFIDPWIRSINELDPQPQAIILATEHGVTLGPAHPIHQARILAPNCTWRHPQAFYLQQVITAADTEWVWILDIDDTALPDALNGIQYIAADVWQMGYERSDGETHIPPQLTAEEFLDRKGNPFVGTSAIRTEAFQHVGGFPDVAFQDYALWRRMALQGMTFESSGRAHFRYMLHPQTRTNLELVPDKREEHLAEMIVSESFAGH